MLFFSASKSCDHKHDYSLHAAFHSAIAWQLHAHISLHEHVSLLWQWISAGLCEFNLLCLFILCGLCFTGPLCGQLSTTNRNISVSTNEVTVRFISGTHRSGRGFVLSYSTNQHSGNGSCPATQHFPLHPTSPKQ